MFNHYFIFCRSQKSTYAHNAHRFTWPIAKRIQIYTPKKAKSEFIFKSSTHCKRCFNVISNYTHSENKPIKGKKWVHFENRQFLWT